MGTSQWECLAALRAAAEELGKSPTKAECEELGLRPASATIIRNVGGWNGAKEKVGLETEPSTGSRVGPKPADVELRTAESGKNSPSTSGGITETSSGTRNEH